MAQTLVYGTPGLGEARVWKSFYWTMEGNGLIKHQAWGFDISANSMMELQNMDAIIADSVISNSTALNLRERGPIIAAMGVSSFLIDIMDNIAPEYLDFMGSLVINGTTFLPISATGVMQSYPNNLLTTSEVQNASNIFRKGANANVTSPIETAHDDFIVGNDAKIGTGHSSFLWRPKAN